MIAHSACVLLFRPERGDPAVELPQLNILLSNEERCMMACGLIVGASKRDCMVDMPVPQEECAVIRHGNPPLVSRVTSSQS